jgi:hypothetical protein
MIGLDPRLAVTLQLPSYQDIGYLIKVRIHGGSVSCDIPTRALDSSKTSESQATRRGRLIQKRSQLL